MKNNGLLQIKTSFLSQNQERTAQETRSSGVSRRLAHTTIPNQAIQALATYDRRKFSGLAYI